MKLLVFIPGNLCTVYVQFLSLRQRCLSKEFGSISSCKPKVCVSKSSPSNSRPSVHFCFYLWSTSLTYDRLYIAVLHLSLCLLYSHAWTHARAFSRRPAVFSLSNRVRWGDPQTEWLQKCSYLFYLHRSQTSEIKEPWLAAWPCCRRGRTLRYVSSLLCSMLHRWFVQKQGCIKLYIAALDKWKG